MSEEIKTAQTLAFQVLQSPQQLNHVWSFIDSQHLLGPKQAGQPPKTSYHTLDIFENILERPFDRENYPLFIKLAIALSGDKRQPMSLRLYSALQRQTMDQVVQHLSNADPN
jgi:hypothetical protein